MNEFALIGAPNVGKTTLFNALTGKQARTGNYAGVTVGIRSANIKGTHAQLYDLPGIYSLSSYSLEEKTAADFIRLRTDCLFVHVAAAANLSRALSFTRELAARGRTVLVVSNTAVYAAGLLSDASVILLAAAGAVMVVSFCCFLYILWQLWRLQRAAAAPHAAA